ncbi:MAG: 16S rRNA (adenine(1518)-N(6)/adenine(1519)-N(6))-dimethyltransferase RsmA [Acidobacteriia bacterium]|nr:16S rRNA (adenine(1518)-N(6)/adenine(1519)-N(6))-dimethyltransferase RsmA [Terriglobia bacterium]
MKRTLRQHTRQRLGQHFLIDSGIRNRILESLRLTSTDAVVEIGAGRGFLTEALAHQAKKVWAVEIDPQLALGLKAQFISTPHVEIMVEDILQFDFRALARPLGGEKKLRVVGNVPYFISSPIIFRLLDCGDCIQDATLMLQKEMADRITASPTSRDYGYASVATQLCSRATHLFAVPPKSFFPPPQVQSAVIQLTMASRSQELAISDTKSFLKFAQQIFTEKRKTLLNNLKRFLPGNRPETSRQLMEVFDQCQLDSKIRAENLSLEATARLYAVLRQRGMLC